MNILSSILLGAVQGLTEFLPISSSGHLIITRDFLNLQTSNGLAYDAVLQLATTLAILIYFRKDIWNLTVNFLRLISGQKVESTDKTMIYAVIIGTIPAVIAGLLLEDIMATVFRSSVVVVVTLIAGGILMLWSEKVAKQNADITMKKGFKIGLFQTLALMPGMSRSGMTISGGLFSGLKREVATRFSFILAFPILLGSGLKKVLDLQELGQLNHELLIGFVSAFVVGMFAIHFLIKYLKNNSLKVFAWYRFVLAAVLVVALFV